MADLARRIADDLLTAFVENGYLHSGVEGLTLTGLPDAEAVARLDEMFAVAVSVLRGYIPAAGPGRCGHGIPLPAGVRGLLVCSLPAGHSGPHREPAIDTGEVV